MYKYTPTGFMLPTSRYKKARADKVIAFIGGLRHTTAEWAGKPFVLLDWQERLIRDVFGIVKPDGSRQFNTVFLEIGKKNGKSELGAAIALYLLCADDEQEAKIYGCANTRPQAAIVFNVAKNMIMRNKCILSRVRLVDSYSEKQITYKPTRSAYTVTSSEAVNQYGHNISGCMFDELVGQPNRSLYDTMTNGGGVARRQPLNFIMTTAGTDRNSICYEVHQTALDILSGRKTDPTFYPVIYSAPEASDWTNPEVWKLANPSLGHIAKYPTFHDMCEQAKQDYAKEVYFRQFFLNQWVAKNALEDSKLVTMELWDACNWGVDADKLLGRECYAGLDLSRRDDISAFVLVFPPDDACDKYQILPFFWLPRENIMTRVTRHRVPYDIWARRGLFNLTEGDVIDYRYIQRTIIELGEKYNIREIAFDRWGSNEIVQNLTGEGFTMVSFGQGFRDMSPPTKDLQMLLRQKRIAHGGNVVLRWMADNVTLETDAAGNIKPSKKKSPEKIDGIVAMLMGLRRAILRENDCYIVDGLDID